MSFGSNSNYSSNLWQYLKFLWKNAVLDTEGVFGYKKEIQNGWETWEFSPKPPFGSVLINGVLHKKSKTWTCKSLNKADLMTYKLNFSDFLCNTPFIRTDPPIGASGRKISSPPTLFKYFFCTRTYYQHFRAVYGSAFFSLVRPLTIDQMFCLKYIFLKIEHIT